MIAIQNCKIFDGLSTNYVEGDVLVEDGIIREICAPGSTFKKPDRIDARGRVLMPGMIDAHVHLYCPDLDIEEGDRLPISAVAHHAARMLEGCLARGFTTLRDTGGAERGVQLALAKGWLAGPRVVTCGKALSQTGGHGDLRRPNHRELCGCGGGYDGHLTCTVDGADALRQKVRSQLHGGASFIKIMGSGGVSTVGDKLENAQYSDEEIRAVVDEVERHGTYVTAHCHPDAAIRRCVELGVHGIEHAILIEEDTARLAAERGTALVPTLAVVRALADHGQALGYPPEALAKLAEIEPVALRSVEIMAASGARVGFGTDLIGPLHDQQHLEFQLRGSVQSPADVLISATSTNAGIVGMGDRIGRIAPGYEADLLLVDGDPLNDLSVFNQSGSHIELVMQSGRITRRTAD
ncbi:amidohydrolase family protein [Rhizorhabdus wittichii]|uniref:Amidohydrolase family protein n=1 Tax=Rhizorhabdus wittichii TaxID=160791 RepID=A0A975HCA9_9SPHN|nr:amidohydrolase family protein [Rhizorhabdus wittichii]QTH20191.1 amidohydrolase family protein [Rhizorhabdus wittichii]